MTMYPVTVFDKDSIARPAAVDQLPQWIAATTKTATVLSAGALLCLHTGLSNASVPQISSYRYSAPTLNYHDSLHLYAQHGANYSAINDQVVREFMLKKPGADVGAIQQILEITFAHFAGVAQQLGITFAILDEDAINPRLTLRVDTYGLDFDRQSEIELSVREVIFRDERLLQAKKYLALSVW